MSSLRLHPHTPFDFHYTVYSHGWVMLLPNHWDNRAKTLKRVERLSNGKVVLLSITGNKSVAHPLIRIEVSYPKSLTKEEEKEIRAAVIHMLRLDENLTEFYKVCSQQGERWKKLGTGLGRLLRSPTLFEDIVKTICTTNIQWGGTKRMVEELVNAFGEEFPGNSELKAFPTPESIAEVPFETFSQKVRMGYRTAYVHLLAERFSSGELDSRSFFDPEIPTAELKKKLLAIKGIGSYAAATLLMLLGRYDELPVDTVFREFVSKTYFKGKKISDKKALAIYKNWGQWKYLAYWFDIWEGYNKDL